MSWYIKDLTKMDPDLQKIIDKMGIIKPFLPTADDIDVFRQRWSAGTARFVNSPVAQQALASDGGITWSQHDIQIPVRDGDCITARVYSPNNRPRDGAPAMVIFHGGGWCLGGLDTEEFQCQLWCQRLRVVVVNVAYRLAPEYKFPVFVHDAYDTVRWVAKNAASLGANLAKGFIIGGFSGGAALAAVASHLARDDELQPAITGVFLCAPPFSDQVDDGKGMMDLVRMISKTGQINRHAMLQNEAMIKRFTELSQAPDDSPLACPLLFATHRNLPPTYIQTYGLDPFCDTTIIYEHLIRAAGSLTKLDVYPGLPHGFWGPFPMLAATRKWVDDIVDGANWLLDLGKQQKTISKL